MGASAPRGCERPGREHLYVVRAVSGLAFFRRGGWRIGFFVACERFTDISDGFLRPEVDRAGGRIDGYFFRGVPKGGYGLECFFQVAETGRHRRVYRFLVPAEEPEGKQVGAESTRGYSGEDIDMGRLYSGEGTEKGEFAFSWNDLLIEVAKEQSIGSMERVDEEPLYSVFVIMWHNYKERKRLERRSSRT